MSKRAGVGLGGCIFALSLIICACGLLFINGLFVSLFYTPVHTCAMAWLDDRKYAQGLTRGVMFIGPVLLLVCQWWMWDRFIDWFSRDRTSKKRRNTVAG